MERLAVCSICGKNIAGFSCMKCGANVCKNCFIPEKQLCKKCLLAFKDKAKTLS